MRAIARLFANQPHHLIAFGIEDNDRDAKREVFEVMAHTEPVLRHGIVKKEVLDLLLDSLGAFVHIIAKATAIAHLSIELPACRERLVALNKVKDVIWQIVVATPRDVRQFLVNYHRTDVHIILEHLSAVNLECRRSI